MTQRHFLVAGLLAVLLIPSAVAAQEGPRLSRDWKRIAADGLEVVGDASEKDLRRVLKEIAAFRSSIKHLLPQLDLSPREPTTLVVFRNYQVFGEFVPRDGRGKKQTGVGGYFRESPDRNYLVLPVFDNREAMYQTIFHEYTHYIVSRNYRDLPRWLNEGMADFYSTFEVRPDGRALIGRTPSSRLTTLRSGVIPPLSKLLTGESALRLFDNDNQTSMFYAQSWLFVHYMTLAEQGSRGTQISTFLDFLRTNKSAADAAREAFGKSLEALDRDVRRYAAQFTYPAVLLAPPDDSTADTTAPTALTMGEVATLKARLLVDARGTNDAEKYVTEALKLAPTAPDAQITLGLLKQQQELDDEAVRHFAETAAVHRESFPVQYFYANALLNAKRYQEATNVYQRALAIHPQSHSAWFNLSLAHMGTGQQADSDTALRRAQELYSSPQWYYARAYEATIQHRDEIVLADAAAFIDRVGGGEMSGPYAAFLAVIAARRLSREPEGMRLLDRIMPALPPKSWVLTVARYMKGELTHEEFLSRAQDNGQRTEARAYIGFDALRTGNSEVARSHFTWIKDKGDKNYSEYRLATEELKRIPPAQ